MTPVDEWVWVELGHLGQVVTGRTPPQAEPEHFGSIYPFITPSDMSFGNRSPTTERFISEAGAERFRRIRLPVGSTCFVCIGATIGKVCLTSQPSFTNQQLNSIVPDEKSHDARFIYYLLVSVAEDIKALASGAATPIINKSSFSAFKVKVPPLPTQRRIASILSAYDDLIENNTRRIAILEEMARRLYEEWFVHFRFPTSAASTVSSTLLLDVADVAYGKGLPSKNLFPDGDYPVYGAAKIIGRYNAFTEEDRTIIAGCRGSVGKFTITEPKCFVTNNSFTFKPKNTFDFYWLFYAMSDRGLKDVVSGSAQPQITLASLSNVELPLPTATDRKRFSSIVHPWMKAIWNFQSLNANLRAQHDLLLPKLVSGEIDVVCAEDQVEAAVA